MHSAWRAVPGRFKDYISTPKQNNYQSIHTTVVGPRHQWVELQIRTRDMDQIAEYGVAAHALYKDGEHVGENGAAHNGAGGVHKDNPYIWLRRLVDTLLEGDNPEEFLEHTKLELFQDQVFCFTPKGRLIALPRGATPIDFAYAVHTDVGNACVGAVINGRQLPLTTQLKNGDQVEILMAKGQTPPAAWERIAVTGKARSSIRRAARDALRKQYSELGRRLLVSAFRRIGQDYTDEKLKKGLVPADAEVGRGSARRRRPRRAAGEGRDPRRGAGGGACPAGRRRASRSRRERGQGEEGWFNVAKVIGLKFRWPGSCQRGGKPEQVLPIRGLKNDVPVMFEEGGAVPGDRIVGVLSDGEGIRIFQIHSPKLKDYEHEKLDRRHLGHRSRPPGALSGQDRGHRAERAGHAGADRAGDRRGRRQHRQRAHDAPRQGLHRDARSSSRCGTSTTSRRSSPASRAKPSSAASSACSGRLT